MIEFSQILAIVEADITKSIIAQVSTVLSVNKFNLVLQVFQIGKVKKVNK